MEPKLLLEWIKALGSILISWPVVGMTALALFRKPLFKIIEQFSNSEIRKAKFGPLEIEREINLLTEKVKEQKDEQERQKSEIDTLRFLISNFVTNAELIHLQKLTKDEPFIYEMAPYFELELRRLRSLGLITNFENKGIRSMPQNGNLKEYFTITESGKDYLKLRKTS